MRDVEKHRIAARERYRNDPQGAEKARIKRQKNLERYREIERNYRLRNPKPWLKKYGLSVSEWERMVEDQNGKCAICGVSRKLCVDHDHKTGKVRGLLCRICNSYLGVIRDCPEALKRAILYLTKSLDMRKS